MESKKGGRTSRIADESKKEQFLPDELEKFLILLNNDDDAAISVVNDVDNAPAPNFTYVNSLVLHPDVIVDPTESNFIASCSCSRSCKLVNSSTAQKSCLESHEAYSYLADGSLYNPYVKLIYECNSNCKCNLKCTNRIVQRGRSVQLQIFRTKHKGWGVRALQDIPKGRFVCKYTGLVITSDHAEVIGKEYDQRGSTYLFDLDAETSEDKKSAQDLCIDANSYGNISRFINHSCSPNLGVYTVVTDSLSIYDLSFFTLRPVKKYEELFIDYSGGVEITNLEDKKKASKCFCMSSNCKGYLFM
ncbi:SET domain-containing protein [Conidiobolus coronatus NRRL 28638]|uniref:SET domain-containing protein n=1 Tax=Conidiobolus coronatus (strain ATCC 28846 / CBS 209.66 / NRRL 28638) TaxID=796925 RepID=A0A137NR07_CONC2|nr:SET domain-containing protein [Conidiobolus coronatus NRRL 28638]|eukprot:KXN65171.1 SET domain-containing protein [Conidiobolus coronatus NRRL 28638]